MSTSFLAAGIGGTAGSVRRGAIDRTLPTWLSAVMSSGGPAVEGGRGGRRWQAVAGGSSRQ